MSDAVIDRVRAAESTTDPLVVISSDGHVSPSLETELRPYCPSKYLETYDYWLASTAAERAARQSGFTFGGDKADPLVEQIHTWNLQTEGHPVGLAHLPMWDVDAAVAEVEWARAAGLQAVADRINAPTLAELSQPIDSPPSHWGLGFRTSAFYS
jgi:hypothetical protein